MFILWILVAVIGAVVLAYLYANRDPERADPKFAGFVSPANGIVVDIIERSPGKQSVHIKKGDHGITAFFDDFPDGQRIIVIMMKPWHVHTQRAPIAGRIVKRVYKPGLKLNAVFGDYQRATVENEHVAYTIQGTHRCKVYAIAGLLARRVRPIASLGDSVTQSARLSKITFGSQVAIVLPKTTKLFVKRGDTVFDGITKLAE